ncbi:MAG: aminoacetone oxidase family FAD-binding enzyme [Planctomycetes bacterium]|nr:aminoacetone oxidase family FAD-binding enzyme [Planctomycetota bacterium]
MVDADVVVVGAGAAGLMAALVAAGRGRRTVLLEKNQRPGLKILISGGGRCNLTTTRSGGDLEGQYGARRGRFLRHALRSFPPSALRAFFEAAGVALQEEDLEKVFPVSQRARDVLEALLAQAAAAGVVRRVGEPVLRVEREAGAFQVATPTAVHRAASVVLATGGLSYPKTGTTGDGYAICRAFGHTITATWPALAPLVVEAPWVHDLQGIVVHGVDLAVLDADGRERLRRQRPILFTHKGLSGPAPMDLAGDVEELQGRAQVRFDFAPTAGREELEAAWLAAAAAHGGRRVETLLPDHLPERLRTALVARAGAAGTLANLAREARRRLLGAVKDLRLPVPGSLGFDHAEVTRGGVDLDEIDPRTMQSRRQEGLYVCGELLDVDGPIGGFNFQAAFATGRLAGASA